MSVRENIAEYYRQRLGALAVGDRLTSVAETCQQFETSTATAVYGLRPLVDEGLVRSEQGPNGGYFVAKYPSESQADLLTRLADLLDETARIVRRLSSVDGNPA
ncbi:MAG: hypothetical protein L0H96_19345 [Humibacillus sp.]|nr:hypothetical protein [Humibacillus sp.]MDN5779054.1 hypothetical protein [Humibacillus sp.]